MNSILIDIGILAIFCIIVYLCKQGFEYLRRPVLYESDKVYLAAEIFSSGAALNEVEALLNNCIEFDEADSVNVLNLALPHREDTDGGYSGFLHSVNIVLGHKTYIAKEMCKPFV